MLDSLGDVRWAIITEYGMLLTIITLSNSFLFQCMMLMHPQWADMPTANIETTTPALLVSCISKTDEHYIVQ